MSGYDAWKLATTPYWDSREEDEDRPQALTVVTKLCGGCRFWSEMCAQAWGDGPVEALCLSGDGPRSGRYTTDRMTCPSWKSGHYGAVDSPPNYGEEARAAYAADDADGEPF